MSDKEVFCEQIRLYERSMYAVAFSVVRNDADAAEIISESIFRAYKNIRSLKSLRAFKPWILRIVHNTAVEFVRKNQKYVCLDDADALPEEKDDFLKLSLSEAVDRLGQPYRTAIVLYYYEDFSVSQIAKITESDEAAVRQRLSRARKRLRELLKEDFVNE